MSTKAADLPQAITDQARPSIYDSIRNAAGALGQVGSIGGCATAWNTVSASRGGVYYVSQKAAEASRQIERVKSIASICKKGVASDDDCVESIGTSVALISSLVSGPLPIPVASSGEDGCTTLFFDGCDFYGDIEVHGKSVEYYIKSNTKGKKVEFFGSEEVKNGILPPKLLSHLFAHYAR